MWSWIFRVNQDTKQLLFLFGIISQLQYQSSNLYKSVVTGCPQKLWMYSVSCKNVTFLISQLTPVQRYFRLQGISNDPQCKTINFPGRCSQLYQKAAYEIINIEKLLIKPELNDVLFLVRCIKKVLKLKRSTSCQILECRVKL